MAHVGQKLALGPGRFFGTLAFEFNLDVLLAQLITLLLRLQEQQVRGLVALDDFQVQCHQQHNLLHQRLLALARGCETGELHHCEYGTVNVANR